MYFTLTEANVVIGPTTLMAPPSTVEYPSVIVRSFIVTIQPPEIEKHWTVCWPEIALPFPLIVRLLTPDIAMVLIREMSVLKPIVVPLNMLSSSSV